MGGRQKGTPNKNRFVVRSIVEKALDGKTIPEKLLELTANGSIDQKMRVLELLLPYCYPKLSSVVVEDEESEASDVTDKVDELVEMLKSLKGSPG